MSREKIYAVDSTKGSSMINPLNYKGDVLVQVWVDSRVLATIVRWMDLKGNYPRFMSQGVRRPLEVLTGFLVDNNEVEMIDDTAEARVFLTRRFNIDLNRGGRGEKNVAHNLTLSNRRGDLGERIQASSRANDVSRPIRGKNASLVEATVAKYKELFPKGNEVPDNSMFKVNRSYDDTKIVIQGTENKILDIEEPEPLKEKSTPEEIEERMRKIEEQDRAQTEAMANIDFATLMATAKKEK